MKNWKPLLLLALVFFSGVAVGVLGTRVIVRRVVQQAIAHPAKAQSLMERNLTRRLRLDNGQQLKLHEILTDARGRLRELQQQFQPRTMAVVRGADEKIAALLTPEQQARFEKIKEQNRPVLRALRAEP